MGKQMSVYQKLLLVQKDLSEVGIAKGDENKFQGYKYRGIDSLLNALSPLLCRHAVVIIPRITNRIEQSSTNAKGVKTTHVALAVTYEVVDAETGDKTTVDAMGEGIDSLDKATNKAMTSAYKYAMIQLFAIPIVGTDDADAGREEKPVEKAVEKAMEARKSAPEFYPDDAFKTNFPAWVNAVQSNKITQAGIIQRLETVGALTDQQKAAINSIKTEAAA